MIISLVRFRRGLFLFLRIALLLLVLGLAWPRLASLLSEHLFGPPVAPPGRQGDVIRVRGQPPGDLVPQAGMLKYAEWSRNESPM